MSNNALAVLNGSTAVQKLSEADQIFQDEGLNYEDSFTFIPSQFSVAPGGGKSFVDKAGEMVQAPLTGIIFDSVRTRGYWPEKNGNKIPFCSSIGGVVGTPNPTFTDADFQAATRARVPHPAVVAYDKQEPLPTQIACAQCPMNAWGSAHQGGNANGKACLEKRRLLFLPDGWHMPLIINLPTMSVKGWDAYCSTMRSKFGLPFYAAKVTLKIEKRESADGNPYGEVVPNMAERITDATVAKAVVETQRQFRELLRNLAVENDFDTPDAQAEDFTGGGRVVDETTGEILDGDGPPF